MECEGVCVPVGTHRKEILGCVVASDLAERFRTALGEIGTEAAIFWFILEIAEGRMHLEKEENSCATD